MPVPFPTAAELLGNRRRFLITGGAGFIGGALVRRLLQETDGIILNLDKMGYASDLSSILLTLNKLGSKSEGRHKLLEVNLCDKNAVNSAIEVADPDIVFHLAAESHVDRSISSPEVFINSNINGTFNLLNAINKHHKSLKGNRKDCFRLHHISTDEVFGSLGKVGSFCEETPYAPSSPYSASKAASDHLVNAWHTTYELPVVTTNCSNNYGAWQFPEKLIPVVTLKASQGEAIPLYGDGMNVRDWLYVEDHIDALLLAACKGELGRSYCIGGHGELTNKEMVKRICTILDKKIPAKAPHAKLIEWVDDRPGHDRRYSIDPSRIYKELKWTPRHEINQGLQSTVEWYLSNKDWCKKIKTNTKYNRHRGEAKR